MGAGAATPGGGGEGGGRDGAKWEQEQPHLGEEGSVGGVLKPNGSRSSHTWGRKGGRGGMASETARPVGSS